ncbi:hypothetical protein LJC61_01670 [Ruminococcaceae bacterium OttesenSCG-928-A16]|nr:hypothetical protein [Ruminococcaceae bacterium OttesenSCG-928-A16]
MASENKELDKKVEAAGAKPTPQAKVTTPKKEETSKPAAKAANEKANVKPAAKPATGAAAEKAAPKATAAKSAPAEKEDPKPAAKTGTKATIKAAETPAADKVEAEKATEATAETKKTAPTVRKIDPEVARRKKEEQARKGRRRNRQLLGVVLSILIVVGVVSIIQSAVRVAGTLLDNTDEKAGYEFRIAPMVWFDLLPFENPEQIDENSLKELIIFGLIDNLGNEIQHDENGSAIVPVLEVDRYAANLFGPGFTFSGHQEFTSITQGITYQYNEALNAYIVAGTGLELAYAPTVIDAKHERGGVVRVVVGYVSTKSKEGNLLPSLDYEHPVRYMDYMFQRNGSEYYLFALRPNTTQPIIAASGSTSGVASLALLEDDSAISIISTPPASSVASVADDSVADDSATSDVESDASNVSSAA